MKVIKALLALAIVSLPFAAIASAHPGRTDARGGHTCRTNCAKWGLSDGEYHYHNGGGSSSGSSSNPKAAAPAPVYTEPKEVVPPGTMKVNLPSYSIIVNGQQVANAASKYPVFEYKNITYFPMTWNYTLALGLETKWDADVGFVIRKTDRQAAKLTPDSGTPAAKLYAQMPDFNVYVNDAWIDNDSEEYPLLVLNDVTYFPMTWQLAVEELGLTIGLENNTFHISK
jgi:hypothetical protein